jgi:hypothetical protein
MHGRSWTWWNKAISGCYGWDELASVSSALQSRRRLRCRIPPRARLWVCSPCGDSGWKPKSDLQTQRWRVLCVITLYICGFCWMMPWSWREASSALAGDELRVSYLLHVNVLGPRYPLGRIGALRTRARGRRPSPTIVSSSPCISLAVCGFFLQGCV